MSVSFINADELTRRFEGAPLVLVGTYRLALIPAGAVDIKDVLLIICSLRSRGRKVRSVLWNLVAMAVNNVVKTPSEKWLCLQASTNCCVCMYMNPLANC
jgi:hypothetical protein